MPRTLSARPQVSIFWYRRDLRIDDNAALARACAGGVPVLPFFIFDKHILSKLEDRDDARVDFIHHSIEALDAEFRLKGSGMLVEHETPERAFALVLKKYDVRTVYAAQDYEPYAIKRDEEIAALLAKSGATFELIKDQVIFEKREIAKADGLPYTVYGAYARKWRAALSEADFASHPSRAGLNSNKLYLFSPPPVPSLAALGFKPTSVELPPSKWDPRLVEKYATERNFPAVPGTTRLGIHLRFGSVSVRQLAKDARALGAGGADVWLGELVWREFFMQILFNFPHVVDGPFRPEYERVPWLHDEPGFERWRTGTTGFPMVDAAMRELEQTGFMHNRARMIAGSFLCKHLLIDWRWGEAWFARKLLDYELSSNNGNWQWVAGCGCDAAPYFRVFNPELQAKKFDALGEYVKKWVPELKSSKYPAPMVDHAMARMRAIAAFKSGLGRAAPAPTRG